MKLAIITDTHLGCRSGSSIFREYFRWYYSEILFPYMEENCITNLLHGGDFFDDRNSIKLADIDFITSWFAPELVKRHIHLHVILGNHDVAFRNTNRIHSLSILKASAPDNVTVYEEAELVEFDGQKYAMIPWINSENRESTIDFINGIEKKEEVIILGHFEIIGMKMYANSIRCDHGLEPVQFKDFKRVLSGHFHHMSEVQNILYLGSTFHLTWQDYGDPRGFHVFDTKTRDFEFIENEHCLFIEVAFDKEIFAAMTDAEYEEAFNSRFVRVVVTEADYDKVALMDVISKINRTKPHDLVIQNDTLLNVEEEDGEKTEEKVLESTSKTTAEYIESFVKARFQEPDESEAYLKILERLYSEATALLTKGE